MVAKDVGRGSESFQFHGEQPTGSVLYGFAIFRHKVLQAGDLGPELIRTVYVRHNGPAMFQPLCAWRENVSDQHHVNPAELGTDDCR